MDGGLAGIYTPTVFIFMESIFEFLHTLKDYLNPKFIIDTMLDKLGVYVYLGLFFIVFAETGLAVGFFLPGDSLLVVSGLFAAAGKLNIALVLIAFFLGSVIGDSTGYWTGRTMGKTIFNRESSFIFKPSRVEKAKHFFEKYGAENDYYGAFHPDCQNLRAYRHRRDRTSLCQISDLQFNRRRVVDLQYGFGGLFHRRLDRNRVRHQT